ncbi:MAG: hypothetical protein ACYDAR_02570 [Thermomicrobiales bacterium]
MKGVCPGTVLRALDRARWRQRRDARRQLLEKVRARRLRASNARTAAGRR